MENKIAWHPHGFVTSAIRRSKEEPAFRAAMRRAANPATAAFAWEHLVAWCDITKEWERLPFALIGAAVADVLPDADGKADLGELLRKCCSSPDDMEREKRRLRRILSCDSTAELCNVLRPVLKYLQSNSKVPIGYATLLSDILYFSERVKLRWAESFFGNKIGETEDE